MEWVGILIKSFGSTNLTAILIIVLAVCATAIYLINLLTITIKKGVGLPTKNKESESNGLDIVASFTNRFLDELPKLTTAIQDLKNFMIAHNEQAKEISRNVDDTKYHVKEISSNICISNAQVIDTVLRVEGHVKDVEKNINTKINGFRVLMKES